MWHKVFDDSDDDDDAATNVEVYKPDKFGHQVAKKTHERVVGNTDENARNDGGEFNLDTAIAEEMSKDDDDEDHIEGTTWKGGVPVVKGHKTCEYCSNRGACLTETTCQCPAIYEGEKLRDFVDHPRVMKGFKKGFEGASLLAKANTKNNMPLMVRGIPTTRAPGDGEGDGHGNREVDETE